jgi:hypothetical protein
VVQFAWPHPSALRHIVVALAQRGQIAEYSPICRYASTRERKAHINHSGVGFGPHPAL